MGCLSSKEKRPSSDKGAKYKQQEPQGAGRDPAVPSRNASIKGLPKANSPGLVVKGGPLSQMDYNQRIISSMKTKSMPIVGEGYSIRYAYVSQRGEWTTLSGSLTICEPTSPDCV